MLLTTIDKKRKVQVRFGDSMFCFVLNAVLLLCPPGCGCCGAAKVSEPSSSAIWCRRLGLESNALSSASTTLTGDSANWTHCRPIWVGSPLLVSGGPQWRVKRSSKLKAKWPKWRPPFMTWFMKNIVARAAMATEPGSPVRTGWVPRPCPGCSHQRQPNCKLSIPPAPPGN